MTLTPLPYESPSRSQVDFDHIKLLVILTYIWGGLLAVLSCLGLVYVFLGIMFLTRGNSMLPPPSAAAPQPPIQMMGWMFAVMGGFMLVFGWTVAGLNLYSARCLQLRKRRIFSLVMAGINCISFPLGTALGVFTFIVLLRESVAQIYATAPSEPGRP